MAPMAEEDTLRVMVVTDTHLGFREEDPVRANDAFDALEEVLRLAQEHDTDMVLHGGDLFHINKPTRRTLVRTIQLLRKYCLGDRPVGFRVLKFGAEGDAGYGLSGGQAPNFEDADLNIGLPVFALHGNHDDPSGVEHLSAMDLLDASRLLNYFGKTRTVAERGGGESRIQIRPVLLEKGRTRVALYGMGWINDARCARMFRTQGQVEWLRPGDSEEYPAQGWFNVFAVHQNRNYAGAKNHLSENLLPPFLDLVVWGHEHESIPRPAAVKDCRCKVLQAGSTVATSLNEGEAKPKHCFLLEVNQTKWRLNPVALRSVRPMAIDRMVWRGHNATEQQQKDFRLQVTARLEDLVDQAAAKASGSDSVLPLVRLQIQHERGVPIPLAQLMQQFVGRVANPGDVIGLQVNKARVKASEASKAEHGAVERAKQMHDLISSHLPELQVLHAEKMQGAIGSFVEKEEKKAIEQYVRRAMESAK